VRRFERGGTRAQESPGSPISDSPGLRTGVQGPRRAQGAQLDLTRGSVERTFNLN